MHGALRANSPEHWDRVWSTPELRDWRPRALAEVYDRIVALMPHDSVVADLGGGAGFLGERLQDECGCFVAVAEHNSAALDHARARGLDAYLCNLEGDKPLPDASAYVATEVLEHLTPDARARIYRAALAGGVGLFSVPHNRLGPDEEPEHTRKWTAKQFLDELREHFGRACRVEVIGEFLLGVCGAVAMKSYRLSVCLPVRDEAEDLRATLASFRGVADQLVVGVDPRTTDNTREVAAEFADLVFDIANSLGPPGDGVPEAGVHFGHIRNECIDKCDGDWIFMTEGHERLADGQDVLLQLVETIPEHARVCHVLREGNRCQWGFPWLFVNSPDIRFSRATHNILSYPAGAYAVALPQVRTLHERVPRKDIERHEQRAIQNRLTLMRDWLKYGNENSLHYLGSEWRQHDPDKAIEWLRTALREGRRNGARRYHTRLILAKCLILRGNDGDRAEARDVLLGCAAEDWCRTEHWVWLGDIAFDDGDYGQALTFFRYGATTLGEPPFTLWWIDLGHYSWIPAQRLAMTYGALGNGPEALAWARRYRELLPSEETEAIEEAERVIAQLEEAIEDNA